GAARHADSSPAKREPVPGSGERDQARTAPGAMSGEHRAHAAPVRVGASDDLVCADALEHRDPGSSRQAPDRLPQLADRRALPYSHRVHRPVVKAGGTLASPVAAGKRSPGHERNVAEMKLGVHVGYWGLGMGPQDQLQVVQEAERLGYDSVWT